MNMLAPLPIQSAALRESARAAFGFGSVKAARPMLANPEVTWDETTNGDTYNVTVRYQLVIPCESIVLTMGVGPS